MIRIRMGNNSEGFAPEDNNNSPDIDRRETTRRTEDYFWLERLGEMSSQSLIVFDKDLNLEFANELTLTLFDISENEFRQINCYDHFIEYCVQRGDFGKGAGTTLKALSEDLKTNTRLQSRAKSSDLFITTPAGKHLCLRQSYGRDGRMLLAMSDVTESYESKEALELALKVGAAGYWSVNFETNEWKLSSQALVEYFGEARLAEAEKKGIMYLIHKDDRERCQLMWDESLKTGENWDIRTRLVGKNNESIWFRGYGVPRFSDNGRAVGMFCYYLNISEEMRLQNEQRKAVETAQAALKAKNSFLARLSHEVRTPMNAVIGISDALIHHHPDPNINPKLELIQNSADKILRIVDETLDHSKMEEDKVTLDPTLTNPKKCVETVCRLWEEQAAKNNVKLTYSFDTNLPEEINMDGYRYEQCVNNLISNAVKFSPGGKVHVVLTKVAQKSGVEQLVLAVKDTGIGMTPAQQSQVFEAYTQADKTISSRFGGTGLGMTITKQIVELMGGTIKVKSAEGEGTVFVIATPCGKILKPVQDVSSQNLVSNMLEEAEPKKSALSHLRVLVVDDNATNHMVVASLLDSLVGQIVTANDGKEAIDCLETQNFDVVLMDIHMPVMDGIEATLSIRGSDKAYANIPIIALTADPQYQQKRLCMNIGMDEALAKPVKLSEILKAFEAVGPRIDSYANQQTVIRKAS